jgi:thiol-disulfide isomerase/thioredoxin
MVRILLLRAFAALTLIALAGAGAIAMAGELKPAAGNAAPFVLRDLSGREHRLADYRGKVVVLNFWATWCEPCRKEMPSLDRLAIRLEGKPFAVLAVDFGEDVPRVSDFASRMPLSFPLLLDRDGAVTRNWKVYTLPHTFVIDAAQRLRYAAMGALDWDAPATVAVIERRLPKK